MDQEENKDYANKHVGEDKKINSAEPDEDSPEEKANHELLDPEIRMDTHEDDRDDPIPKDMKPSIDIGPDDIDPTEVGDSAEEKRIG